MWSSTFSDVGGTAHSRRTSHARLRRVGANHLPIPAKATFRVLHVRVTEHPTGAWIIQQLREAFPFDSAPRYLIFDNDKKYGADVLAVIVLNERHLHRLLSEFLAYYHDDRTHLGVGKGTPSMRAATSNPHRDAAIVGHSRIGGLHHRYEWRQAA